MLLQIDHGRACTVTGTPVRFDAMKSSHNAWGAFSAVLFGMLAGCSAPTGTIESPPTDEPTISNNDPTKPVLTVNENPTPSGTPSTVADAASPSTSSSDTGAPASDTGAPASDASTPSPSPPPLPGWTLTWSDEFNGPNGSAPDPAKWVYDIGYGEGGWGNGELQYYTNSRDNSYLQDGSLVIAARTDNLESTMLCGSTPCKYTSARLKTLGKFSQTYGRFEARIKIPIGNGMWPAFWTLGTDFPTAGWPKCGEIDIMENWGADGTVIAGTTHDPGYDPDNGISGEHTFSSITTVANDYHVYAVEWEVNAIRFYVDGSEYHCVRTSDAPASACGSISGTVSSAPHTWPFNHPFFMLLNLAIDGDSRPTSTTKFPGLMFIDYVRVYKH